MTSAPLGHPCPKLLFVVALAAVSLCTAFFQPRQQIGGLAECPQRKLPLDALFGSGIECNDHGVSIKASTSIPKARTGNSP